MRTRIKICGVTNVEDALLAARAGADAVGIIQVRGAKRCIPTETAAAIAHALPAYVTPVLVFADAHLQEMQALIRRTGVRTVQLHGHEKVEIALALHSTCAVSVIKRLEVGLTLRPELEHWSMLDTAVLGGLLLEGPGRGGTGVETDWQSLHWALEGLDPTTLPPLILAGGLKPENVSTVIRQFKPHTPHAVDTSSGVENPAAPLRKDPRRLQAFIDAVQASDTFLAEDEIEE